MRSEKKGPNKTTICLYLGILYKEYHILLSVSSNETEIRVLDQINLLCSYE